MSIRKRGNTYQVDVVVEGKRQRLAFATLAQAQEYEASVGPEALTLSALRDSVIARVWADNKSAQKQIATSKLLVDMLGPHMRVADVTTRVVDTLIEKLEAMGNANGTVNRKLAVLSKMLRFAKQRDYIASLPHLQFKRAGKGRDRFFTPEEEARMLALLSLWSKYAERDLIMFLLDTGARVSEALDLEWQDVGAERVTFRDTKNGTTRSVPLTTRAKFIVIKDESPRPFDLSYIEVYKVWERMREHLGFAKDPGFVIHSLRHTCASRLVQRGASIQYVSKWLGHKTINMTMRYAHLAPTSLDSMVSLLEQQPAEKPRHLGVVEGGQNGGM